MIRSVRKLVIKHLEFSHNKVYLVKKVIEILLKKVMIRSVCGS